MIGMMETEGEGAGGSGWGGRRFPKRKSVSPVSLQPGFSGPGLVLDHQPCCSPQAQPGKANYVSHKGVKIHPWNGQSWDESLHYGSL